MATLSINISNLDGTNGFKLSGAADGDRAFKVSSAGDVNGDGFGDVLVGAYYADAGGIDRAGQAYLIFGAASGFTENLDLSALDAAQGFRIDGEDARDSTGTSVSGAGDLNGDGFDDILIGANQAEDETLGQFTNGLTFAIFGKATGFGATLDLSALDASQGLRISGDDAGDNFGIDVSEAGDVNGDGFADFIGAAQNANTPNGGSTGQALVIFGTGDTADIVTNGGDLDGSDGFRINGITDSVLMREVGSADVNADGFTDLLLGAHRADINGDTNIGQSYVVFGKADGFDADIDLASLDGTDGAAFTGAFAGSYSGTDIHGIGDINGDGFDDFAIGAPNKQTIQGVYNYAYNTGETYILFGKASGFAAETDLSQLDAADGFTLTFEGTSYTSNSLGRIVGGAGDFNGDGFDDLLVTAPAASGAVAYSGAGEVYVIFGNTGGFASSIELAALDSSQGLKINGAAANDRVGYAASGAGDLNGDGFDDVIIGSQQPTNNFDGEAYVVFGGDVSSIVTNQGTAAGETVTGNGQANVMILGQGDDIFNSGGDDDIVRGGEGRDTGSLGGGDDRGFGGAGDDVLNGSIGNDFLDGGTGSDRLLMGIGNDTVHGGAGNDLIFERANHLKAGDNIFGGEGTADTLVIQSAGVLDLTLLDTFAGVERVKVAAGQTITSTDDDLFYIGRSGAETYGLGAGDDIVKAGGGNDIIIGGDGDDFLIGQGGDDTIRGGAGFDRIIGSVGTDTIVLEQGGGLDLIFDFANGTDLLDVSRFLFNDFETDLQPLIRTIAGKAVIDFADGGRVVLSGVAEADLAASDFLGIGGLG